MYLDMQTTRKKQSRRAARKRRHLTPGRPDSRPHSSPAFNAPGIALQLFGRAKLHCTAQNAAVEQIKDQAFSELAALIEESDKLLKDSASLVGEEADTVRAQLSQKLKQAMESVSSVRDRTKPAVEATENYIGGHPWQTVAVSAGFGLVVGLLLGRR
jgi:ElaB/YqjD/DUF883 family membrane-anchored ribosome-binding protein